MSLLILFPILVSILAGAYVLSPVDFIPDFIPVLGWSDDLLAVLIAIGSWLIYLALPILTVLIYGFIGMLILVGLLYLIIWLTKYNKKLGR